MDIGHKLEMVHGGLLMVGGQQLGKRFFEFLVVALQEQVQGKECAAVVEERELLRGLAQAHF